MVRQAVVSPADVIALIQSGGLQDHILLVQGGTTTFLAPALSMGAIGVITMSGAPESHLGILSREFQTPCVMTAYLPGSDSRYVPGATPDGHFAEIAKELDGRVVRLDRGVAVTHRGPAPTAPGPRSRLFRATRPRWWSHRRRG